MYIWLVFITFYRINSSTQCLGILAVTRSPRLPVVSSKIQTQHQIHLNLNSNDTGGGRGREEAAMIRRGEGGGSRPNRRLFLHQWILLTHTIIF